MDEYIYDSQDSWEYGTGSTQPPKSRGGLVAALLIAVIFLTGIVTVLGILNIRLVKQLGMPLQLPGRDASISFSDAETRPLAMDSSEPVLAADPYGMDLHSVPAAPGPAAQGQLTLQQIYQQNIPSVVSITCHMPRGSSSGTGVVLTEDGYLVTNAHVVDGAFELSVLLSDGRQFAAEVVGKDTVTDLAVLHIDADDLTPAVFGDSDQVKVGDSVVAIGDPLGIKLRGTMTDGIISAINRDIEQSGWTMSLIQTNAALNSGNSGGPLLNCFGQVIGINTMKISAFSDSAGVEGLGFAIPSATVKEVAEQLISQGYVSGRPRMGVAMQNISSQYLKYYNLPAGIRIVQVEADSPAQLCGMKAGDILLAVDNSRVTSIDEVNKAIYAHKPGDTVKLTLYRNGQQLTVNLTLGEAGA